MKEKSTLRKSGFFKTSNNFSSFIAKVTQPDYFEQVQKKQSQKNQQIIEDKESIFYLIVEMFKQVAQQLELDSRQIDQDSKINIYVSCVQKLGALFCENYNQKCDQMYCQIKSIKSDLNSNVQRLRNYMQENQFLKDQIQRLQGQMHLYNQQLDKSEHELQKGKSQIQNEINQKQLLNHELEKYISECLKLQKTQQLLNHQIQILNSQMKNNERQKNQLKNNLNQNFIFIQNIKAQNCQLLNQKECLQKQIQSLKMLIDQKDYLLQNKDLKSHQIESLNYSVDQNHAFILKSNQFNIVTQQKDEQYGSDKDVLKDIEYHHDISIGALKFSNSKSGSDESQTSLRRSYQVSNLHDQTLYIDDTPNKQIQQNVIQIKPQKIEVEARENNFSKQKQLKKQSNKKNFHTPIPKDKIKKPNKTISVNLKNEKIKKQGSTNKNNQALKKQDQPSKKEKPIYNLNLHQIKSQTKSQYNQKIILSGGRKKTIQNQRKSLQSNSMFNLRAEHCQSAEDLFKNQTTKKRHSQRKKSNNDFQSMIKNKDKIISHLQKQVKKTAEEASQKLTQNQGQYQMILQKLQFQIKYYKDQFKNTYNELIIQRANSEQYKYQIQRLLQQVANQKQDYDQAYANLKMKCSKYLQEQINEYKLKYEEIQHKMEKMLQNNVLQKRSVQKVTLKKSNSSSLFYNEVKHHSYHCSQDYSQINKASPNALSKQLSVLCSQSDQIQNNCLKTKKNIIHEKDKQKLINIQDYDEVEIQSWAGKQLGIDIQVQTDQIEELKSSINFSSLQLSQDNSQCKIQETTFKSTYIQQKISKFKLNSCQQMKIVLFSESKQIFLQNQQSQTNMEQIQLNIEEKTIQKDIKSQKQQRQQNIQAQNLKVIEISPKRYQIISLFDISVFQKPEIQIKTSQKISQTMQQKIHTRQNVSQTVQNISQTVQNKRHTVQNMSQTICQNMKQQSFSAEISIQAKSNHSYSFSHLFQFNYDPNKAQKQNLNKQVQKVNKKVFQLNTKQINLRIRAHLAKQKDLVQKFKLNIVRSCQIIVFPTLPESNNQQTDSESNISQLNQSNIHIHSFSTQLDQTLLSQIKKLLLKLKQSPLQRQPTYQTKKIQSNIQQIQKLFQNIEIQRSKLVQKNQIKKPFSMSAKNKQTQKSQKQPQLELQFFYQKYQENKEFFQNNKAYRQNLQITKTVKEPLQILGTAKVSTNLWTSQVSNAVLSSTNISTSVSASSSPKNLKQKNNIKQFSQIKQQDQQIDIYEEQINNSLQSSHSKLTNTQRISFNSFQIKKKERKTDKKRVINVEQLIKSPRIKKLMSHKFCKGILNNLKQIQFLMPEEKNYIVKKFRLKGLKIKQVIQFNQDIELENELKNQREGIIYSTNRRINEISQKQIIILNCSLLNNNLILQNFALSGVKMIDLTRKCVMNSQKMICMKDSNMLLLGNNQIRIYNNSFQISLLNKNNHFQSTQNVQDGKWKIIKAVISIIQ